MGDRKRLARLEVTSAILGLLIFIAAFAVSLQSAFLYAPAWSLVVFIAAMLFVGTQSLIEKVDKAKSLEPFEPLSAEQEEKVPDKLRPMLEGLRSAGFPAFPGPRDDLAILAPNRTAFSVADDAMLWRAGQEGLPDTYISVAWNDAAGSASFVLISLKED